MIGDEIFSSEKPSMRTPELAKAKIGKMKKLTIGEILWAIFSKKLFLPIFNGINNAKITPAKVAWSPDFNIINHNINPSKIYRKILEELREFKIIKPTKAKQA